ncbi:MAG: patatin-like phospholipase family protein [Luteimonas sp.]
MTTTAFVFAGGGSLGAVQVGMLKALTKASVTADFVVGASVGALNAAYYAASPDAAGIARLERIWMRLNRADVFPFTMLGTALCLLGRRESLAFPHRLRALIESELPCKRLQDTVLPCHVVATDALDGTEVTVSSGEAVEALLASAAIPAIFPVVNIGGRSLIDGGIASNTPISAAFALGATRMVVLPTGMSCALRAPPHGAIAMALHALNLLAMRQLLADVDRFAGRCVLAVVPPLCPMACTTYDFSHTAEHIARAEKETSQWLGKGGLEAPGDPRWPLAPHRHQAA